MSACRRLPLFVRLPWAVFTALGACGGGGGKSSADLEHCAPLACLTPVSRDGRGVCHYLPQADGAACEDGNPCTTFQTCVAGKCAGGSVSADGTPCDDQNACTQNEACLAGVCSGGEAVACPPATACRAASTCEPSVGCLDTRYPVCVEGLASVAMEGCVGSLYTAPVTLGTTTFSLLADTGSSTTAVAASNCFNCAISPNYAVVAGRAPLGSASSRYSDASGWNGSIYAEQAWVGGMSGTALSAPVPFRFVAIAQQQNNFFVGASCTGSQNRNAYQGILGLGSQAGTNPGTQAFVDAYVASGGAANDAFSLQLCDLGGRFWLGGYNPAATTQPPTYTPMVSASRAGNHYAVAIDDVRVGADSLGLPSYSYGVSYVDTGTNALLLPQLAYNGLVDALRADKDFVALFGSSLFASTAPACATPTANLTPGQLDAKLPTLSLVFPSLQETAGTGLSLTATQSYLSPRLQSVNGSDVYTYCTQAYPSATTVLGAAVLRGFTVVFDRAGQKIGFAPQKGCTAALPRMPSG